MEQDRGKIRQQFRDRRKNLKQQEREHAADAILEQCKTLTYFTRANKVALYLANDGEIDPYRLIRYCWETKKQVYLPILHPFNKNTLLFNQLFNNSRMKPNRFGIPEPALMCHQICPLEQLDVLFTPLVAFDDKLNRMGMGGGFYDRTLAPVLRDKLNLKVVGLAHDCQQAEQIPSESWDIPLSTIVTPTKVFTSTL